MYCFLGGFYLALVFVPTVKDNRKCVIVKCKTILLISEAKILQINFGQSYFRFGRAVNSKGVVVLWHLMPGIRKFRRR